MPTITESCSGSVTFNDQPPLSGATINWDMTLTVVQLGHSVTVTASEEVGVSTSTTVTDSQGFSQTIGSIISSASLSFNAATGAWSWSAGPLSASYSGSPADCPYTLTESANVNVFGHGEANVNVSGSLTQGAIFSTPGDTHSDSASGLNASILITHSHSGTSSSSTVQTVCVTDSCTGDPISSADVSTVLGHFPTAANGCVTADMVHSDTSDVVDVTASGYCPQTTTMPFAKCETTVVNVSLTPGTISGTLTYCDNGLPVVSAPVNLTKDDDALESVLTNGTGFFTFNPCSIAPPNPPYLLRASVFVDEENEAQGTRNITAIICATPGSFCLDRIGPSSISNALTSDESVKTYYTDNSGVEQQTVNSSGVALNVSLVRQASGYTLRSVDFHNVAYRYETRGSGRQPLVGFWARTGSATVPIVQSSRSLTSGSSFSVFSGLTVALGDHVVESSPISRTPYWMIFSLGSTSKLWNISTALFESNNSLTVTAVGQPFVTLGTNQRGTLCEFKRTGGWFFAYQDTAGTFRYSVSTSKYGELATWSTLAVVSNSSGYVLMESEEIRKSRSLATMFFLSSGGGTGRWYASVGTATGNTTFDWNAPTLVTALPVARKRRGSLVQSDRTGEWYFSFFDSTGAVRVAKAKSRFIEATDWAMVT